MSVIAHSPLHPGKVTSVQVKLWLDPSQLPPPPQPVAPVALAGVPQGGVLAPAGGADAAAAGFKISFEDQDD